jgi:hypothetical protein
MIWNILVIFFNLAGITYFKWDAQKKGQGIQIYNNWESLYLNETCYAFRSIVANQVRYFNIAILVWCSLLGNNCRQEN